MADEPTIMAHGQGFSLGKPRVSDLGVAQNPSGPSRTALCCLLAIASDDSASESRRESGSRPVRQPAKSSPRGSTIFEPRLSVRVIPTEVDPENETVG
jgi:hypothetical protein